MPFLGNAGPLWPGALMVVVRQLFSFFADSGLDWRGLVVAGSANQARRVRVCIRSVALERPLLYSLVVVVVTVVVAVAVTGYSVGSWDLAGIGASVLGLFLAEPGRL
jgi:hypothetical protein